MLCRQFYTQNYYNFIQQSLRFSQKMTSKNFPESWKFQCAIKIVNTKRFWLQRMLIVIACDNRLFLFANFLLISVFALCDDYARQWDEKLVFARYFSVAKYAATRRTRSIVKCYWSHIGFLSFHFNIELFILPRYVAHAALQRASVCVQSRLNYVTYARYRTESIIAGLCQSTIIISPADVARREYIQLTARRYRFSRQKIVAKTFRSCSR